MIAASAIPAMGHGRAVICLDFGAAEKKPRFATAMAQNAARTVGQDTLDDDVRFGGFSALTR
jgi:hypothetical protein